jgi:hypothetical protein
MSAPWAPAKKRDRIEAFLPTVCGTGFFNDSDASRAYDKNDGF